MSEAYWIGGLNSSVVQSPQELYAALLKTNHLRDEQVEELHCVMDGSLSIESRSAVYRWMPDETLEMNILAGLGRALRLYERDTAGWLCWHAEERAGAVLVSPRAVGRLNLMPRARLSFNLGFQDLSALEGALRKNELEPQSAAFVSLPEDWIEADLPEVFAGAERLQGQRGLISRLQNLIETLERKNRAAVCCCVKWGMRRFRCCGSIESEDVMAIIFLALGTNLGDRTANLQAAISNLESFVDVRNVSPIYQTAPWGVVDQPDFLNQVLEGETELPPVALLERIKDMEAALGRKPTVRYGPRLIDIDILFYDDQVLTLPELNIPHERIAERAFVLVPLADIAPDFCHPVSGLTVSQLLSKLDRTGVVAFER